MKKSYSVGSLLFIASLLFSFSAKAQQGCPFVDAGPDKTIPCGSNCTSLTANYFETGNTNSYTVSQIPYAPLSYTAGTDILVNIDDQWSPVVNLPFTFCFFDQPYTQVVVGSNGVLTFDAALAGTSCSYTLSNTSTLPSTALHRNSIMAAFGDIDPKNNGRVNYQILGTAPCRIFVISWYDVPYYGAPGSSYGYIPIFNPYKCQVPRATFQTVLYETTNAIEVYIANHQPCPGWNGGLAIQGIQNATGTVAYTVPGRNSTQWSASNDARRFTPNGPSIVTVEWLDGGNVIATGPTATVCPTNNTTYTARATYLPCNGGTPIVKTDAVNITLPGLKIDTTIFRHPTCFGAADGSVRVELDSSIAVLPLTYGWSNGQPGLGINNLAAGTYIFTATDAANCLRSDTIVLINPPQLVVNVPDANQTNCSGTGTGTLVAAATGGTGAYTYTWNSTPIQNDSLLNGVPAGTYNVVVTDSNGCTATDVGNLTIQPGNNNVVIAPPTLTQITCNGANNGAITVSASGNSGVFTYSWNNGAYSGATISNLPGGIYNVTADDGGGCTASATYNITEPTAVTLGNVAVQNIGCVAGTTGSIAANAAGGTGTLTYNWTQVGNSQTYSGATISNLNADTYTLTVSDANACSVTGTYTVTQVTPLSITESKTDITCYGANDGSATITVNTGTPPYQYNWNGAGNTNTNTIGGLGAGPVTVVVSDANCTATASVTIAEPTEVVLSLVNATNISCYGYTDGSITVTATGGAGNYQYVWSDGQTGPTASNLPADVNITVTATDASMCVDTAHYVLTQPSVMSASATANNAICYQSPTGNATATAQGGVSPYSYAWNDGQTTKTATSLMAGAYTVVVTDAGGCSVSAATAVSEPSQLVIDNITATPVKCPGQKNGTITVTSSGGNLPHNNSATQDGSNFFYANNGVIEGLDTGTYLIIVSDNVGCTTTQTAYVPNAVLDVFTITTDSTACYGSGYNDGEIHVFTTSLNGPYWYSLDGGAQQQLSGDFYALYAGNYTITAISANQCTTQVAATVYEPLEMYAQVIPDTLTLALGESGQAVVSYQNANNVTYLWQPGYALSCADCPNPTVTAYERQDYVVTVSRQSGLAVCTATAKLHVAVLEEEPVYVPNAFTPNGDGNNDVFQIYGQDIKTASLKVFNRWGELVFASTNQFYGWDGTYKGQLSPMGVYTYVAEVTYLNNKTADRKGTVNLIR